MSGALINWTSWLFGAIGFIVGVYQTLDGNKQKGEHRKELAEQKDHAEEQRARAVEVGEHNKTLQAKFDDLQVKYSEATDILNQKIREYGRLRSVWYKPSGQDSRVGFVGRRKLLDEILGIFALDRQQRIIVLCGRPGIGKTRITDYLAGVVEPEAKHPFRGDGMLWSELGKAPDRDGWLKEWYKACDGTASDPGDLAQAVRDQLNTRHPLVVMDDVRSFDDIERLIDATPGCPTLVTTADERVADEIVKHHSAVKLKVTELEPAEAEDLLREQIGPALGSLPPQYIASLVRRIDADPFSVIQLGSYVTDTLRRQNKGVSWQAEDLDDVLFSPFAGPDPVGGQQVARIGNERSIAGTALYRARIEESLRDAAPPGVPAGEGMLDSAARDILRLMAMLRPRPESFSAAELAEIAGGDLAEETVARNLLALASRSFVIREEPGDAEDQLAGVYSLHRLARSTIKELIKVAPDVAADTHRRAISYWSGVVDPNRGDLSSYLSALNREGDTWQRGSRNLLYHLGQLEDRHTARLAFDKVYFELFWWWGAYIRYPVLEDLLDDWKTSEREYGAASDQGDDDHWFRALTKFHKEYRPAHSGKFFEESDLRDPGRDWPAVEEALTEILHIDHLDGDPARLAEHEQWHIRALIEFFLADASRYYGLTDQTDEHYATARQLLTRCVDEQEINEEDCAWNLAWLDYEEADNALDRAARGDHAQYAVAIAKAASSIRIELTDEPAETGGEAELMTRPDIDDWEILALACRAWGDAVFAATDPVEATRFYQAAAVFAFAWQYYQKTTPSTDAYTQALYGDILRHIVGKLQAANMQNPARAAEMVSRFLKIRDAFGAGALDAPPEEAGDASRASYFRESFPRQAFGIANVKAPSYVHQPVEPVALADTVDQMLTQLWHEVQGTAVQSLAAA